MKQLFLCGAVSVLFVASYGAWLILSDGPTVDEKLDALAEGVLLPEPQVSTGDLMLLGLLIAVGLLFLVLYRTWDAQTPKAKSKHNDFQSPLA